MGIRLYGELFGRISTAACTPALTIDIDARIDAVYHLTDCLHGLDIVNTHQVEAEAVDMEFINPILHALQHKLTHQRPF